MRIIPVIDLMGGLVVRGIGGRREEYRPVVSRIAANAQPATVAQAFHKLGYDEAYVADLDAIAGNEPAWRQYETIADAGLKLWVDAGLASTERAEQLNSKKFSGRLPHRVVVGLETLASIELLSQILAIVGCDRLAFSLDLKQGVPLTTIHEWRNHSAFAIAREVLATGIRRLMVLDLADVGAARGSSTIPICRQLRSLDAKMELIAGGGIRTWADLDATANAGCDAALVSSALHNGQLRRML